MRKDHTLIPTRRRLPPLAWLVLLSLVPLLVPSGLQAQGQGQGQIDMMSDYIERTEELITWAADMVAETESGTARSVLRQAQDMNRRASDAVHGGQYGQGANQARRARAAVWHAVKLAREAMGLQERLRVRAERFRELHLHLAERARDLGNEGALDMLRKAESQAHRAREQHLQGDLRMAWQMFERAEDMTAMAARQLAETGDPQRLEQELERVSERLEHARSLLGEDASRDARRNLAEAEEALDRARNHMDRGEPGRALQMVGLARRLADRALDRPAMAGASDEAVRRQMEHFDNRLPVVEERLREQDNEQARSLANRARDHRERAAAALGRDAAEEALRQIKAAHDLLAQAERMLR